MEFFAIIAALVFLFFFFKNIRKRADQEVYEQPTNRQLVIEGDVEEYFILSQLPKSFDKKISIESETTNDLKYDVNLYGLTCDCPDFIKRRADLQQNDIHRICKHIKTAMDKGKVYKYYNSLDNQLISEVTYYHGAAHFLTFDIIGEKVIVTFPKKMNNYWINIFVKVKSNYKKFGYDLDEERWAYNKEPNQAEYILNELSKHIRIE